MFLLVVWALAGLIQPRYRERLLHPDDYDGITFTSAKELCFEALQHFSPTLLQSYTSKAVCSATRFLYDTPSVPKRS